MEQIEVTKLSSKGQVVLPQAVRQRMHLIEGETLIVFCDKDSVILKKIERPVVRHFQELLRESRAYAKKLKLKQTDVKKAIQKVRNKSL